MAFQEYQETYRKTCLELKGEIKETQAHCAKLRTDIKTQEREEKYWKRRYETRDIVSPISQDEKNENINRSISKIIPETDDNEV